MIRVSNRHHSQAQHVAPQVQHVERIIEAKAPDAIIQYIDREVIREVPVPGDTVVMASEVDLQPILDKHKDLDVKLQFLFQKSQESFGHIGAELEMQRRALVAIKTQRDVDRSRRLMLIKRMKKDKKRHALILKLSVGASILVSLLTLLIRK